MAKKILIAEDEEVLLDILSKKLNKEGYQVFLTKDGKACLETMKKEKPDLVLLDILMPKKNGFEVLKEMQKDEVLKEIPVIVVSNSGQPVELNEAIKLGAKDWLIKAEFDIDEVLEKVKKQIGK
jgi:DNA-binding response OmpR family regulator